MIPFLIIKERTNHPINSLLIKNRCWQRAIFPGGGPPSIFASVGLYDRVRDGNGWFTYDWPPTNFSFADADYLQLQLCAEDCTRYNIIKITFFLRLFNIISACQIKDLSVRSAFASLTTAALLNLRSATCSSCLLTSRHCCVASFILLRKALVRLVMLG